MQRNSSDQKAINVGLLGIMAYLVSVRTRNSNSHSPNFRVLNTVVSGDALGHLVCCHIPREVGHV